MKTFYQQFVYSEIPEYSLVVEDDGRVCYAYLLEGATVVGDVWLYNRSNAPEKSTWKKEEMPFLNPTEYLKNDIRTKPISSTEEVEVKFISNTSGNSIKCANIYLKKTLTAVVKPGWLPGWSKDVVKDGPLAKRLDGLISNA